MDLGIDIGSSEIKIYASGKGVVLVEPNVVAIDAAEKEIIAYGKRARRMIGRNPDSIEVIRPVEHGLIAGFDYCEYILKRMIQKVCGNTVFKPKIVVAIPSTLTNMDRLTIFDAVMGAGARKVCPVEKPLLASFGAGIEFGSKRGSVVIDIGAGTMDAAVVTYGGLALHDCLKLGGTDIDEAIIRYVYEQYGIRIGERTAEEIKKEIGTAIKPKVEVIMAAKGLNINTGLPDVAELSSMEVYDIISEYLMKFASSLAGILEQTPPELVADISLEGIHMCGGLSRLNGMTQFMSEYIGIPAKLVPEPEKCVARGTGVVYKNAKELKAFGYQFRSFENEEPVGINENVYEDQ